MKESLEKNPQIMEKFDGLLDLLSKKNTIIGRLVAELSETKPFLMTLVKTNKDAKRKLVDIEFVIKEALS